MNRQNNQPCEALKWDSEFWGVKIARIKDRHLRPEGIPEVMTWAKAHEIACLYFLAEPNDMDTIRLAESNGFRFVDIRMTFHMRYSYFPSSKARWSDGIRPSLPSDLSFLKKIAKTSYHDSRFYADPNFPVPKCDALYEIWIEKSCQGYADAVIVAEQDQQPVAYVSCHLRGPGCGEIGLVGVSQHAQGRGIGEKIVNASLDWFYARQVNDVSVVTQGRNIKAQRLYQKCGFLSQSLALWYHRWFV